MIKLFLVLLMIRFQPYVIVSGSMVPTFDTGAVIVVDTWDKNPHKGDVASYNAKGLEYNRASVTHRVVGKGKGYIFRGDANPVPDSDKVSPGRIIGKVVFYENFTCPYFCPAIRYGVAHLAKYGPIPRCGFDYRKICGII